MTPTLALPLILALAGQAPAPKPEDDPAARLEIIKKSVSLYDVHAAGDRGASYRLQSEPVLRFTNPVGYSQDGAIFFWLGEDGRPEVAIQAFLQRGGAWIHDFSSLSTGPVVAETRVGPAWHPSRGGVEFKPVPGAPRPAESPESRLRQMRDLVRGFSVADDFREKGWQALRPMSKPFARYGKPGSALLDGAVFCFALGTDPEAYLMLEAQAGRGGPEWQYAFEPQTCYALKAAWKGQQVWSLPNRYPWTATEPFFGRTYRPEE